MNIVQTENTLSLTSLAVSGYRYIHIIQKVDSDPIDTEIIHEVFTDSTSFKELPSDGYYIVTEMKMPTTPGSYYYIVGNQAYNSSGVAVTIEQLLSATNLEVNVRTDIDFFTTYATNKYYIELLKSKFIKNMCSCDCISAQDRRTIDTLTMGLALLKSLITYTQYYEAQRIMEKLSGCTGITDMNCNCND